MALRFASIIRVSTSMTKKPRDGGFGLRGKPLPDAALFECRKHLGSDVDEADSGRDTELEDLSKTLHGCVPPKAWFPCQLFHSG